ncbi:MAG: hypothetical protein QOF02_2883 [Blastocatellia bacterium]|nr:hypothetical protein [Blastocatellia bacterium]
MQGALYHQKFTESLGRFSTRLEDLLPEIRRFEPSLIPAELLDEVAGTLGELMLVLIEHKSVGGAKNFTGRAASDIQLLREALRFGQLQPNQITAALNALRDELGVIIHEDRQAA